MPRAASSGTPPASSARRQSTAAAMRERQLLRLRAAGIVDDAPVGDREGPAKALRGEIAHQSPQHVFDSSLHGVGLAPEAAKPPIGLMLARRSTDAGASLRRFTSVSEELHRAARRRAQVEIDGDAGIELRRRRARGSSVSGEASSP